MPVCFPVLLPHVSGVVDSTTPSTSPSSHTTPSTTFRHRHEPLQHLQPSTTDSATSFPSQKLLNRIHTSAAVRIDNSRLPTIEEHVIHDILDFRRSPNVSSTSSQAAASTTSCCCLPTAFSSSASGNTTSLTFPRRHPGLPFSPSRLQRPVDASLDDDPLQLLTIAAADISGTINSSDLKLGTQVHLCHLFTSTSLLTSSSTFLAHLLMQLNSNRFYPMYTSFLHNNIVVTVMLLENEYK